MNPIYKPSDLLSMAERGILEYEGINISEIVCAATEDLYNQQEYEAYGEAQWDRAYQVDWDDGYSDGKLEH